MRAFSSYFHFIFILLLLLFLFLVYLVDILDPGKMVGKGVNADGDDLHVALGEFGLDAGEFTEFGGANCGKKGVRK